MKGDLLKVCFVGECQTYHFFINFLNFFCCNWFHQTNNVFQNITSLFYRNICNFSEKKINSIEQINVLFSIYPDDDQLCKRIGLDLTWDGVILPINLFATFFNWINKLTYHWAKLKKKFEAPFYGWDSNLTNLERMKRWVNPVVWNMEPLDWGSTFISHSVFSM